jgi:hypothetical protein
MTGQTTNNLLQGLFFEVESMGWSTLSNFSEKVSIFQRGPLKFESGEHSFSMVFLNRAVKNSMFFFESGCEKLNGFLGEIAARGSPCPRISLRAEVVCARCGAAERPHEQAASGLFLHQVKTSSDRPGGGFVPRAPTRGRRPLDPCQGLFAPGPQWGATAPPHPSPFREK